MGSGPHPRDPTLGDRTAHQLPPPHPVAEASFRVGVKFAYRPTTLGPPYSTSMTSPSLRVHPLHLQGQSKSRPPSPAKKATHQSSGGFVQHLQAIHLNVTRVSTPQSISYGVLSSPSPRPSQICLPSRRGFIQGLMRLLRGGLIPFSYMPKSGRLTLAKS